MGGNARRAAVGAVLVVTMALAGAGVAQAAWSGMEPLPSGRYNHTSTELQDGRVLVAGGAGSAPIASAPLASARLYDPATNVWSDARSMNVARQGQAAVLLQSGKVLVAGGCAPVAAQDAACDYTNTAEVYNPDTNTWSNAGSMSTGRFEPTMTVLRSGKVLVAGGVGDVGTQRGVALSSAEIYDPEAGTWSDAGTMSVARSGDSATLLDDGDVLVAGGHDDTAGALAGAELYHPTDGSWTKTADLGQARDAATATKLRNGDVLVAVGDDGAGQALGSAEVYSGGTWSAVGSMTGARDGAAVAQLDDGTVLVAGGENGRQGSPLASTERYDPDAKTWTDGGAMAIARSQHTVTALADGRALAIGGNIGGAGLSTTAVERFSAATANLTPLTFPQLAVGTASDVKTSTLTNSGKVPLVVGAVTIAGGAAKDYEVVSNTCADSTLAPDETCTIDVRFTPSANGARAATLTVADNTAVGTTIATLAGSGPDAPTTSEGAPQGGGGTPAAPAAPRPPAAGGGATTPRPGLGVGGGSQQSHAAAARATCKVSTARGRSTVTCTVTLPTKQTAALRGRLMRGTRVLASAKATARNGRAVLRIKATSRLRAGRYTVAITRTNGSLVLRQAVRAR